MEDKITETTTEERRSWNRPEVQKLTVNLDTANAALGLQSNIDLVGEG